LAALRQTIFGLPAQTIFGWAAAKSFFAHVAQSFLWREIIPQTAALSCPNKQKRT